MGAHAVVVVVLEDFLVDVVARHGVDEHAPAVLCHGCGLICVASKY